MHFLHQGLIKPVNSLVPEAAMRFMTSLRFIDVVAREGSIRKAADKLEKK